MRATADGTNDHEHNDYAEPAGLSFLKFKLRFGGMFESKTNSN